MNKNDRRSNAVGWDSTEIDYNGSPIKLSREYILWDKIHDRGWMANTGWLKDEPPVRDWGEARVCKGYELSSGWLKAGQWSKIFTAVRLHDSKVIRRLTKRLL